MIVQNVEAELSYAYLHAVAARAGVGCEVTGRHLDSAGVDAHLHICHDVQPLTELTLHVQLKATKKPSAFADGKWSYWVQGVDRYNRLRATGVMPPRILVVLFLPEETNDWLTHSPEQLILRRCAYWVSLRGAPATSNETGATIYIPESQMFTPEGLLDLLQRFSRQEVIDYAG